MDCLKDRLEEAVAKLGNGAGPYPNGDEVQTVKRWRPPDVWGVVEAEGTKAVLDTIATGLPDGRRYSDKGQAARTPASHRV